MEFRILGSLEAEEGGKRHSLGGPSEQKALAVLLLEFGRVVPVAHLVDALWDAPPATADKQARNAIGRLRRLLAKSGEPDAVVTESGGYRLPATGNTLDARLFEAKVSQAEAATAVREVAKAATLLGSALQLWRGPALAGLSGRVIEAAATAWDERRRGVVETYCDHLLALGKHRQVVTELAGMVASHPMREKTVRHLMLALYQDGRRADALALYQDTRTLLAEELGLDPGPDLQRLQQQILGDAPALMAPGPANELIGLFARDQSPRGKAPPSAVSPEPGRLAGPSPSHCPQPSEWTIALDIAASTAPAAAAPGRATQPAASGPRVLVPSPAQSSPTRHLPPPAAPRTARRPGMRALAVITSLAVAVIAVIAGLHAASVDASSRALAETQASQVNNVLNASSSTRGTLVSAVAEVSDCSDVSGAVAAIENVIPQRASELKQASALATSDLPGGAALKSNLISAMRNSLQADKDFLTWAQQMNTGCTSPAALTSAYHDGLTASKAAVAAKDNFLQLWNPIASQQGLPPRTEDEI